MPQEKHQNMALPMTRAKLEQLTGDLVARTIPPMKQALADAGYSPFRMGRLAAGAGVVEWT